MGRNIIGELTAIISNIERREEQTTAHVTHQRTELRLMVGQYALLVAQLQNDAMELRSTFTIQTANYLTRDIELAIRNAEQYMGSLNQAMAAGMSLLENLASAKFSMQKAKERLLNL